ncbi:hypothetical protein GUJ93_ZPchr0013g34315 [Zizania palustris]|uniref:Uncharacterized protein n=1 Tax=Zizania palustris TaxID=103762 RepID=A0A8J5X2I0_ZIZPA|nr:hypothetical protein GUJ93_ZPchr0013g34315 [Zizania palustris]
MFPSYFNVFLHFSFSKFPLYPSHWKKLVVALGKSSNGCDGGKNRSGGSMPKGSFAVYVGGEMRQFVILTEYLGH